MGNRNLTDGFAPPKWNYRTFKGSGLDGLVNIVDVCRLTMAKNVWAIFTDK
jgi:hypothetical protein